MIKYFVLLALIPTLAGAMNPNNAVAIREDIPKKSRAQTGISQLADCTAPLEMQNAAPLALEENCFLPETLCKNQSTASMSERFSKIPAVDYEYIEMFINNHDLFVDKHLPNNYFKEIKHKNIFSREVLVIEYLRSINKKNNTSTTGRQSLSVNDLSKQVDEYILSLGLVPVGDDIKIKGVCGDSLSVDDIRGIDSPYKAVELLLPELSHLGNNAQEILEAFMEKSKSGDKHTIVPDRGFGIAMNKKDRLIIGNFLDKERHGFAFVFFKDGGFKAANYRRGFLNGWHIGITKDGTRLEGFGRNGYRCGLGKEDHKNGEFYSGEYKKGKRHGYGYLTRKGPNSFNALITYQGRFFEGQIAPNEE